MGNDNHTASDGESIAEDHSKCTGRRIARHWKLGVSCQILLQLLFPYWGYTEQGRLIVLKSSRRFIADRPKTATKISRWCDQAGLKSISLLLRCKALIQETGAINIRCLWITFVHLYVYLNLLDWSMHCIRQYEPSVFIPLFVLAGAPLCEAYYICFCAVLPSVVT